MKLRLLLRLAVFSVFIVSYASTQEVYYSFNSTVGGADHLFGSLLVNDVSYLSTDVSLSAILSEQARGYLDISHSEIFPLSEYSSSQGELGLQFRYLELKNQQIFSGVYAQVSLFKPEYSYYEGSSFGAYAKWKGYSGPGKFIETGYSLSFMSYNEVPEASNTEHDFHASINYSFPSRTTVFAKGSIAFQDFWQQVESYRGPRYVIVEAAEEIPTNSLASIQIRVSQSVSARLGVTLWGTYQDILSESSESISVVDDFNSPFIDDFRWQGPSGAFRIMYKLGQHHTLGMSYRYAEKSYQEVPVYLYDFATSSYVMTEDEEYVSMGYDRDETQSSYRFQWTTNWFFNRYEWLEGLALVFSADWLDNQSNDPLYEYESTHYSVGLSLNN